MFLFTTKQQKKKKKKHSKNQSSHLPHNMSDCRTVNGMLSCGPAAVNNKASNWSPDIVVKSKISNKSGSIPQLPTGKDDKSETVMLAI